MPQRTELYYKNRQLLLFCFQELSIGKLYSGPQFLLPAFPHMPYVTPGRLLLLSELQATDLTVRVLILT